ncbi:hypothetical protein HW555_011389 [Spodoptera exigua]|uniref:Uncharacterized protein n=1 Tax=Spodoptera exigua TaxID=7107 RepID=A0A835G7S8_SPOEX|nr:hypothetical protein HW555_011389 [Spodoptera exigua]
MVTISVSLCNDIQLEDVLKVSKELLKVLNRNQNIANKLSLPGDFASRDLVRAVNDDYMTRLNNYYNFVTEHNTLVLIEKDYLYLDMVDTYCRLLQNGEEKLLNDIIMRYQTEPQNTTTQAINDKMKKNMIIEKKPTENNMRDTI